MIFRRSISSPAGFPKWLPATTGVGTGSATPKRESCSRSTSPEHGAYTIYVAGGEVRGGAGGVENPDLEIQIGIETWRSLNRGEISAPEAALRRRLKLTGNMILALKLHLILG